MIRIYVPIYREATEVADQATSLLAEFDPEMAGTRRMLERVPDDQLDWRPHPKSFPLRALAVHIAELPEWASSTIATDALDLASPEAQAYRPPQVGSRAEILALFEANAARGRQAVAAASDDWLNRPWTLRSGERVILSLPRITVLRVHCLNHIVHHRAQLGMYFRLLGVAVPGMYGPTADEPGM